MSNQQNNRKIYYYLITAVVLIGLIALLWLRYAATQRIIRNLGGFDLPTREAAAQELLNRGILADVLPAQPVARRMQAASALRGIAEHTDRDDLREKAVGQLVAMLKDPDDKVQHRAWVALAKVGVPTLPFLRHRDRQNKDKDYSVLKEGDARAKQAGMNALVLMGSDAKRAGDEEALDRILSVLGKAAADKDERDAADAVLGDLVIGKEPARVKVLEALKPLLVMAWSKTVDNRKAALVAMGERQIRQGARPALDALEAEGLRQAAIRALGKIGLLDDHPAEVEAAVPTLMAALEDATLRTDAAFALGRIRDARALPALAAHLGDPDQEFWKGVVYALGRIAAGPGETGATGVRTLVAALGADDPRRREGAARALRGVAAPATVAPLTTALRDPVSAVRREAATALGWRDNTAAIEPLIAALARDRSWRVVDNAIEALGEIGRPAISPLIAAFGRRSENEALPLYAERALLQIDATHPQVGRALTTELIAATRNQDANVVKWAAITLGGLGYSEEAAESLRRLRVSREEELAWVAKEALREMGVEIE